MPPAGWLLGDQLGPLFAAWDHWIASGLLIAIGIKMIIDGLSARPAGPTEAADADPIAWRVLVLLAVATSIDAFAAGITLPVLGAPVAVSVAVIAVVTALFSAGAFLLGERLARRLSRHLAIAGGLVLVGLAIHVLIEHLAWTRVRLCRTDQPNPQSDGVPTKSAGFPVEIDRLSADARSPDAGAR
jgi:putative Mn2+ efflux pump MntP